MRIDWEAIDKLAKNIRLVKANTPEYLREQLEIWWSVKYSRPLKDPLLQEYSLSELLYEYLVHYYLDPKNDPSAQKEKEQREKDDEEWVKSMMKKIGETEKETPKKEKAENNQEDKEEEKVAGTDGLFIKPSEVPDMPFPDLPDNISTHFDE